MRALESLLPEGQRLFNDPVAARFLTPLNRLLMRLCAISPPLRNFAERRLDRRFPGVPADFICRTRYIDGLLAESAGASGPDRLGRLVMLGAGYDTHADCAISRSTPRRRGNRPPGHAGAKTPDRRRPV